MSVTSKMLSHFVATKPSPTPLTIARDNGRKAEQADVLEYLVALATATRVEELWEAVEHIRTGSHVREGITRPY